MSALGAAHPAAGEIAAELMRRDVGLPYDSLLALVRSFREKYGESAGAVATEFCLFALLERLAGDRRPDLRTPAL